MKIFYLIKYEFKELLMDKKKIVSSFMMIIIVLGLLILAKNYINNYSYDYLAIVDEDKSMEIKAAIKNVTENKLNDTIKFLNVNLDEGLGLLEKGEVLGVLYIPKGTRDNLDSFKKSYIEIHTNNIGSVKEKYLVEYIEGFVSFLNEGQSGAMVYWNEMEKIEMPYDKRIKELNNMAFDYSLAFLTRNDVFEENNGVEIAKGLHYFYFFTIIVSLINIFIFQYYSWNRDKAILNKRLIFSGYRLSEIVLSKIAIGTLYSYILALVLSILSKFIFGMDLVFSSFHNAALIFVMMPIFNFLITYYNVKKIFLKGNYYE